MATTKKRFTTKGRSAPKKQNQSLLARTGRTVRDRPYASAAIATGAVTAVAAAAAGAFFFSRSNRSIKETADDLSTRVKDGLTEAKAKVKTTASRVSRKLDGSGDKTQAQIAEEALTLKETGARDAVVDQQTKEGAIAY
jgi:ElaB/YqjD/DUF883 family membrane-anchored ribosome-binding protein